MTPGRGRDGAEVMKKIKIAAGLAALLALAWNAGFCAVHGGTEFGITDDLTVFGTAGVSLDDPDRKSVV